MFFSDDSEHIVSLFYPPPTAQDNTYITQLALSSEIVYKIHEGDNRND